MVPISIENVGKANVPSNVLDGVQPIFQFNSVCDQELKNGTYFTTRSTLYGAIDDDIAESVLVKYPFDTYAALSESQSSLILTRS